MRVLLDENLPHDLIATLVSHEVVTVQWLGWAGTLNGELLKRAAGVADVFVTMDRKLERQHDLTRLAFGVVVIAARSNQMQDLLPLVDALVAPASAQLENVGQLAFPTSASPAAQQHFLRGVAILHSFGWKQAIAEFKLAQQAQPDFALAVSPT